MDLEVLRKAPLFTNLDDEVFSALPSELTEVELSRGASAFHEGDQGDQLYVIMSGKIKLGRTAPDGRENLLAVLGPGELFGTRQHGLPELNISDLVQHVDILDKVRFVARDIIDADPKLEAPQHQVLKERVKRMFGEKIELRL